MSDYYQKPPDTFEFWIKILFIQDTGRMNNSSMKEYKPETRNQHIKSITSCPPSTPNRIVFLPKMDGVGFKCRFGKTNADGRISPDEQELSRYSKELKDEVYSNMEIVNNNCYEEWKNIKRKIEVNPLRLQNFQIIGLVALCVIYVVTFYIFYERDNGTEYEMTVFYAYIIFIFIIIGFSIIILVQVFLKKYEIQNLDVNINGVIKKSLEEFNAQTEFNLKWVKPKNQYWIYVKIPDGAPLQRE